MSYLQKKKLAFMSIVNRVKGFVRTVTGVLPLTLTNCVDEDSIIDYTIYGESMQDGTPTPETPIEVESVGEKTRNLFDPKQTPVDLAPYLGMVLENKIYTLRIVLKEGKTVPKGVYFGFVWWTSSTATAGQAQANWFVSNGTLKFNSLSYNSSSNFKTSIAVYSDSGNTKAWNSIIDSFDIYLSEGWDATYEPYGYKIPIKVSGKNLFGNLQDKWVNHTGTITDSQLGKVTQYIPCKSGDIFTISGSFPAEAGSNILVLSFRDVNDNNLGRYVVTTQKKLSLTKIAPTNTAYVVAGHYSNVPDWVLLEQNSTVTDYEPYHEPITTNIYLDEPLRKVGDYADYIDFENGKVVRVIKKSIFTGNEAFEARSYYNGITAKFSLSNYLDRYVGVKCISNIGDFENGTNANATGKTGVGLYADNKIASRIVYIEVPYTYNTTVLLQKYLSDNKVYVIYPLAEPTETPITLPNLPTFKDTSIITADTTIQPSNAEITYYSSLKE